MDGIFKRFFDNNLRLRENCDCMDDVSFTVDLLANHEEMYLKYLFTRLIVSWNFCKVTFFESI